MKITKMSALSFFKVAKYSFKIEGEVNYANSPRPHFCMGLILNGEGFFYPDGNLSKSPIHVVPGDIIFVPITSRYISKWKNAPEYISMHFSFSDGCGISERNRFILQKVTLPDFTSLKEQFLFALEQYTGNEANMLKVLSVFYSVLGNVLPILKHKSDKTIDERVSLAMEYIQLHAEQEISVPALAKQSDMSTSHFYTLFRKEVGTTPVEYKQNILINRAIRLLLADNSVSVEQISSMLGFSSSTYFRRVFKHITGKSPREYRNSVLHL